MKEGSKINQPKLTGRREKELKRSRILILDAENQNEMKQPLAQNAEEGDEMNQSDWESTTDENSIIV